MSSNIEELIVADKEGRLIEAAYELSQGSSNNRPVIGALFSDLHNNGDIDLIDAYTSLHNNIPNGSDFFLSRDLFEKALPTLAAPVVQVMACIQHLAREAGNDLAANTVFEPFIEFLAAESSRPHQALEAIRKSPSQWSGFVCPAILAGVRMNLEEYLGYAIELVSHEISDVCINAIYTLGRIPCAVHSKLPER